MSLKSVSGRLSIILFCIGAASPAMSQQYKYKELVVLLENASRPEQIAMLWEYMSHVTNQPNADFRLAKLRYDIFREKDPLVEYRSAMAHAQEAANRLFRTKIVVTESEVRRDNEYYAPFFSTVDSKGRPYVEYPAVAQKIQVAYDSVMQFQTMMPPIYKAFTNSVIQYGKAVKIFSGINNRFKTLEDILLLFDKDIENELNQLKTAFDSSIVYFDQYTALIREYPLKNYNQRYRIKPIQVYHLDGLTTGLNFLVPQVELWNYSAWVDDVYRIYKQEIIPLKDKLAQNETNISGQLTALEGSVEKPSDLAAIDKDLVFNLNIYDKNSLALALLKYKAFKLQWRSAVNSIGTDSALERKLELYSRLIQNNRTADSLHAGLKQVINPLSIRKHREFLSKYYGGEQGLQAFVMQEEQLISSSFTEYQDTLKSNLVAYSRPDASGQLIKIGGYNIPMFVQKKSPAELDALAPVTLRQTRNPDGSMYLAGIHKMNKKIPNVMVFVARVNPDGRTGWVKEYNLSPDSLSATFDNYLGDIVATQDGCAVIITSSVRGTGNIGNTFVFISETGDESVYRIRERKMARKILYQERSNTFITVFKGADENQDHLAEEPISVISINILGDMNWRRDISISGTIEDVVAVRDGYVLAGNFTAIKDISGKELRTKVASGQTNPYLIKLALNGNVLNVAPIVTPKSIYIESVIKVNDESINLLGYEAPFTAMQDINALRGSPVHLMADYNLNRICSDF